MGLSVDAPVTGYNYFGSFAILVCLGPVKRLNGIYNGDTEIFTGPIYAVAADSDGKTSIVTTIGNGDFYWGSPTQNVNADLNALEIDLGAGAENVPMPAFRNCCYFVLKDAAFGTQVAPPTLKFDIETETSGLAISAHSIEADAVIPEAVYQYLMDKLSGQGLSADDIDAASFIAASETVIAEGLGASPDLDTSEDARTLLGRMLSHIDGFLYFKGGKIFCKLMRHEDTSGIPSLNEADILEDPKPNNKLFAETWNETRVGFRDRDAKWEDAIETYNDDANAAIVGRNVVKESSFPYLTRRPAAKILAKLLGIKGGIPPVYWSLSLKPKWRNLSPGDQVKLSYARLGVVDRICRVTEIRRGTPAKPSVTLTCIEEQTRDTSHDYTPPDDQFTVPGFLDANGAGTFGLLSTTPRLSWLPEALKDGRSDGLLLAMNRPDSTTSGANLYWTWNPDVFAYQQLGVIKSFPAACQLVAWWNVNGNWMLRVKPATTADYSRLQSLAENATELYCVVGRRDFKSVGVAKDEHQTLAPWLSKVVSGRFDLISSTIIDIEVDGAAFGTLDLLLETLANDARYPTVYCYFGKQSDFAIFPLQAIAFDRAQGNAGSDADWKRYVKACTMNWKGSQATSDVTALTFDRNDATMCPDGTYSRDWGARAPTGYELFDIQGGAQAQLLPAPAYGDVADIDQALGNVLAGTASAYETMLVEHIDLVLGKMASTDQTFYNE